MVKLHKANDYTSHGWVRFATTHAQAGMNFWPLCRHEETQRFLKDIDLVVREGDDNVVHPSGRSIQALRQF